MVPSFTLVKIWEYLKSKLYDSIGFLLIISKPTSLAQFVYWYVHWTPYSYCMSTLILFRMYIYFSWINLLAIIWPTIPLLVWRRPQDNSLKSVYIVKSHQSPHYPMNILLIRISYCSNMLLTWFWRTEGLKTCHGFCNLETKLNLSL